MVQMTKSKLLLMLVFAHALWSFFCHPRIIHRDIKSANILLDEYFESQVADFGLAKPSTDGHTHISTRVMGTFGYLAPEYASSGKLTDRSDVFSFGVVLLELVKDRKPVDSSQPFGEESLVDWMILSFELPFTLIPLLKFTSSKTKMGSYTNSILISALTWIIGFFIMAINIYFLATSFVKLLLQVRIGSGIIATVFLGIFGFSGMLVYLASIVYLVVRKNRGVTPLLAPEEPELGQNGNNSNVETSRSIYTLPREDIVSMQLPQRSTASDL